MANIASDSNQNKFVPAIMKVVRESTTDEWISPFEYMIVRERKVVGDGDKCRCEHERTSVYDVLKRGEGRHVWYLARIDADNWTRPTSYALFAAGVLAAPLVAWRTQCRLTTLISTGALWALGWAAYRSGYHWTPHLPKPISVDVVRRCNFGSHLHKGAPDWPDDE